MSLELTNADSYGDYGNLHDISSIFQMSLLNSSSSSTNFFPGGCLLSNGHHDCHAACQNITQVIGNWETMSNCLTYPRITQAMLMDDLTYQDPSVPRVADYGIAANDNTTDIVSNIRRCLLDYCLGTEKNCGQSSNTTSYICYGESSSTDANTTHTCFVDICTNSPGYLNPDLGGIGVYISYWMQTTLALLAFVLLKLYTSWAYYICIPMFWFSYGLVEAKTKAKIIQKNAKLHAIPLLSALIEFHKAQCFFAIAVEVAAQILAPVGLLGVSNLGQLYTNYEFIRITSVNGSLPVTFTLLFLRRAGIRSWYLFTLSTCAVALSAATYFGIDALEFNLYSDPYGLDLPSTTPPLIESCGGINPSAWCDTGISNNGQFSNPTIGFGSLSTSIIVLSMMFLDQCGFDEIPLVQRVWSRVTGLKGKRRFNAITGLFFLVWVNYFIWIGSTYTYLLSFAQAGAIDKSTWGFGQIVAVTIWVPCVFEYFHLEIQGIENVFQLRLGQYYKVVKVAIGDPNPTNTSMSVWKALQYIQRATFKRGKPSGYNSIDSLAPAEHPLDNLAQHYSRVS